MDFINGHSSPALPVNGGVTTMNTCPYCTSPDAQKFLSRHQTADGILTYTRCRCGALHLWLWPHDAAARHVTQGRRR